MKKIMIVFMLLSAPAYAMCSIERENTVCTLPEFREQAKPVFQNNSAGSIGLPGVQLQPLNRADPINQMRESNNPLNYNSGCQFGVCLQNPKDSRLPDDTGK